MIEKKRIMGDICQPMDSNRLRYFAVVGETGSVRKAAELLRLSPAALSKSIKLLEFELGTKLLVPSGRGIMLTDEGRELLAKSRPLLDSLEQLSSSFRQKKELVINRPFRLASFEVFTTHFLRKILALVDDDREMILRELIPGEMERALLANEVDYAITYIPIPSAGIDHIRVTAISMGIFASKEFVKSHHKLPFNEWPFVIPIQPIVGAPNKVQGLDGWPDDRLPRKVPFKATMLESALEICRQGLAAAYVPSFVVKLHNEIVEPRFRLEEMNSPRGLGSEKQEVYLVKRKSTAEDPTFRKLARALRENCF